MSETLVISGSDTAAEETPKMQVFAVPQRVPNPDYIAADEHGAVPEGYDESTPEFITELRPYYMPAEVNPVIGLEYGERSAENGLAATVWLIESVVGREAYTALKAELKRMTPEKARAALKAVSNKIAEVALGN